MFRKILLWFGGMLLFSLVAYLATSDWLSAGDPVRGSMARRIIDFQLSEAIRAYESGGPAALGDLLSRYNRQFLPRHYLTDRTGRDLVTGEDLSALIRRHRPRPPVPFLAREFVFQVVSADGKYIFLLRGDPPEKPAWTNMVVYGWIVLVIVLLCYVLAMTLVAPVRNLRQAVVRFGSGDLESRTKSQRKDELGELARAFDQMADRIQTLLYAERRLLQDVSHELRSPLTRLRFALELARSSPDPKAALDRVNTEVDRLAKLVDELLLVTRLEGDPEARGVEAVELGPFLKSLVEDSQIEAEATGCGIELSIKDPPVWHGNRELLQRAVENVLRNAIRHAPKQSSVEVALFSESGQAVLRIRDHGPGVPGDQLEQIFRPFYRVEEDRSRDAGGGVGLGLAIAQRAIVLHHGEIRASNAAPGLLVEIRLPLREEEQTPIMLPSSMGRTCC